MGIILGSIAVVWNASYRVDLIWSALLLFFFLFRESLYFYRIVIIGAAGASAARLVSGLIGRIQRYTKKKERCLYYITSVWWWHTDSAYEKKKTKATEPKVQQIRKCLSINLLIANMRGRKRKVLCESRRNKRRARPPPPVSIVS